MSLLLAASVLNQQGAAVASPPVVESASSGNNGTTATSVVVNMPSGVTTGDLLIAQVTISTNVTPNTPSGWTLERSDVAAGNIVRSFIFSRVADGTEGATQTFDAPGSGRWAAGILRISGADTTTPVDVDGATVDNGNPASTNMVAPSVTTTVDNTLVLRFYALSDGRNSNSTPTGLTEAYDTASGFGAGVTCSCAYVDQASAGASGTATSTTSAQTPEYTVSQTVAIAPA